MDTSVQNSTRMNVCYNIRLRFLGHSQMVVDLAKSEYYFGFAPGKVMTFICLGESEVSRVEGAESYEGSSKSFCTYFF